MTVIQFPVFVEGQTLTDDDLNGLRDALEDIDRRIGRTIGFGINCGLNGSIAANKLSIETGIAIDQLGQVLELDAPFEVSLAPTASPDAAPAFVDAAREGFTPVLMLSTTDVEAPHCNEAGCEGHATQRELESSVAVFKGRLRDAIVDFGDEKLLEQDPLTVRKTGTVAGGFVELRDAIVTRMGDRLDAGAKAKLSTMTIAGDVAAIQGFKAGFLNEVFFASLDLLRCELETSADCVSAADGVGVALGWLHQAGGTWEWDCRYRHDWDVPIGVALALIGGNCSDPCDLYRDRLNALINAFEVPVVPAPPDEPDDGGPVLCYDLPDRYYAYPYAKIKPGCERVLIPPDKIKLDWQRHFREKLPIPPIPPEEKAGQIYQLPPIDWVQTGTITLTDAIGKRTTNVVTELTDILTSKGNPTPVGVFTQATVKDVPGYQPGVVVSAGDKVVLVEDELGKVIGMGSIPANAGMVSAVADVPKVVGMAQSAETAAKTALDTTATFTNRLDTVDHAVSGFTTFQANILQWQSTVDVRVGGLTNEIDAKAIAAVSQFGLAMQSEIDERIGAAVNAARGGLLDQLHAEMQVIGADVKADVAKELQATTSALRKEVEADQRQLSTRVEGLDQQVAILDGQVQVANRDAERSNQRIDAVLTRPRADIGGIGGVRDVVDSQLVSVIGNMRSSILAAATRAQRAKVNAALGESADAFKAISEATAAGPVELETQRVALGSVLTSMTTAVEAAGAPAADVDRLRGDLGRLIDR
jgi:outer membrane murein-binding lipoprotein Lpp